LVKKREWPDIEGGTEKRGRQIGVRMRKDIAVRREKTELKQMYCFDRQTTSRKGK
jgi:hypothetical protein